MARPHYTRFNTALTRFTIGYFAGAAAIWVAVLVGLIWFLSVMIERAS